MTDLLIVASVAALCLIAGPADADDAPQRPSFRELGYRLHPPAQWLAHGIAAGALVRITGVDRLFRSSDPDEVRDRAAQAWRDWYAERVRGP